MSSIVRKRKRARVACIPCHQRKRKCDGQYPCSLCTEYDYECRYTDEHRSRDVARKHAVLQPQDHRGSTVVDETILDFASSNDHPPVNGVRPTETLPREMEGIDATTTAFPHALGQALDGERPLDTESLANNFGSREEITHYHHPSLSTIISEAELDYYSANYFPTMGLICDFVDPRVYAMRCRELYQDPSKSQVVFGAVAAGIAALGSFLSPQSLARESDLVLYAKAIMDDPSHMNRLDVDLLTAWAFRLLYLRATTRPIHAWMASCTLMHLCEAAGLHDDRTIRRMASTSEFIVRGTDPDMLRRMFWIAWAGNNLMSYEYDRSPVTFRTVTTQAIMPTTKSLADQFVRLAQILPSPNSPFQLENNPSNPQEDFSERLKVLDTFDVADRFLLVTKADIALCFYRRLHQLKTGISDECIRIVIDTGNAAVIAAEQLAKQGLFFWNVIGSVFQYACVLLAMETPASSTHIAATLRCLDYMAEVSDTKATRDARSMVHRLLHLSVKKKRKELSQLESVQNPHHPAGVLSNAPTTSSTPDLIEDFDWDQFFLEPSMFDWLGGGTYPN